MKFFPQPLFTKLSLYTFVQVIFISIFTTQFAHTEIVDKVLAVVNDDVITLSEVDQEAATAYRALTKNNSEKSLLSGLAKARERALNTLISRRLIQQRAKLFKIRVSKEEVDNAYARIRKRAALDPETFKEKLENSGLTEESYRKSLEEQILQSKLISFDVRSKIAISEEMIRDYYNKHYTSKVNDGGYYLLQMGFTWDSDKNGQKPLAARKKEAEKRAKRVYNLVKNGGNFKSLAKKFSDMPSAVDGGDIGLFTLDEMAQAMRTAVAPLRRGELSKIIETTNAFQFFKLLSNKKGSVVVSVPYDSVKKEIKEKLYELKLKEAFQGWVKDLKDKAYIQKL